ncbi:conserved rodent malaria protein, unknown function [Plasmodium vinckei brucechwatti]|uniref:Fam-a protein n=1 Tax=Plasmodium vinckei brucechwatti TaxID=119398 RepID=A0A6V7S4L1_PLAVN|nr:conserved rodent malaria protein, unknown function [Plasmodium vinckei brucechwatti]
MLKFILLIALLATFAYGSQPDTSNGSRKARRTTYSLDPRESYHKHLEVVNELFQEETPDHFGKTILKEGYVFIVKQCDVAIHGSSGVIHQKLASKNQHMTVSLIKHHKHQSKPAVYILNISSNKFKYKFNFREADLGKILCLFANEIRKIFFKGKKSEFDNPTRDAGEYLKKIASQSTIHVSGLAFKKRVPSNLVFPLCSKFNMTFEK